jgi:hypothetical protein
MAVEVPTYTFEGNEIFAIHEGKVIASGTKMGEVESTALEYLEALTSERDAEAKKKAKKRATHIITPNGIKGEILGTTPSIWGERVSVRLANGEFREYETRGDEQWITEKTASVANPADGLEQRLAANFDRNREGLIARLEELASISREASDQITLGAPYLAEVKLDEVRTAAEAESRAVKEALDHLDSVDAENFIPNTPFQPSVVEQADLGRAKGDTWLDSVTNDMIAESEGQDFEKILTEGPALFVTDLDDGAVADTGVTREMALSHITARTAGFQGEEVDTYREQFLARVEIARRAELADRKTANHKEAAAVEETLSDVPDEALFG